MNKFDQKAQAVIHKIMDLGDQYAPAVVAFLVGFFLGVI